MLWMLMKAQIKFKTSALQQGLSERSWHTYDSDYQNLMGCTNVEPLNGCWAFVFSTIAQEYVTQSCTCTCRFHLAKCIILVVLLQLSSKSKGFII